jgi:Zinc carboxypeptidase
MRTLARLGVVLLLVSPIALRGQSGSIPTPESVLGFQPGADFKLATYDQVVSYFQKVDAASDRMTMAQAGKTTQGRTFYFALISSKENLSKVDHYREIARRLAHPEGLTDAEAKALAREGKAFVHIDGGLHATEIAGPQQTPQLLYDLLARADQPEMKEVLDNVIFMLWPTINPDGMQMVTDWFMSHVDPANPRGQQPPMPYLYQEYVGHDNNRDAYMLNMVESRVMEHTWRSWEPNLVYVLHQAPPNPYRIWLPPFAEPIALHAPPIPSGQVNTIGMAIAQGLAENNQPGAVHMLDTYDAWYPGYIDYNPIFKNIPSFWTETAGASAIPSNVNATDVQRQPKALYTDPFPGGEWHLRNAVEYDETAALSVLRYAAKYKESLLYGRYQSGMAQIAKGRSQAPYAYVIPQAQRDPVAAVELLRRLAFSGIRVYQLTGDVSMSEKTGADAPAATTVPAGSWVVPTDQEFAALTREVLDVQVYPDVRSSPSEPLNQPYDAAGWTLPLSMGVTVTPIQATIGADVRAKMRLLGTLPDPKAKPTPYNLTASADLATFDSVPGVGFDASPAAAAIVPPVGKITGTGTALALDPAQNNAFRAMNKAWKAGVTVQYASGKYLVNGLSETDQNELVKTFALTAERVNATGTTVKKPRLGLFNAPTSMDEGWTRWVLDQYGFEYARVSGEDIAAGHLRDKLDVLIVTDEGGGPFGGGRGGGRGGGGGTGAPAGAAGARGGAGGAAGAAGGATAGAGGAAAAAGAAGAQGGGFGGRGGGAPPDPDRVKAIDEFVRAGGTLVCFNRSSMPVVDQLHLPVKNAVAGIGRAQFFTGISLLNVQVDRAQRVMSGMPDQAAVFYDGGPVFETLEGFNGTVLARYAETGQLLASGYLLGDTYLRGKAAALDVPLGDGHVVLLGFRPQWRGQPFGSFRVIFNAAVYAK